MSRRPDTSTTTAAISKSPSSNDRLLRSSALHRGKAVDLDAAAIQVSDDTISSVAHARTRAGGTNDVLVAEAKQDLPSKVSEGQSDDSQRKVVRISQKDQPELHEVAAEFVRPKEYVDNILKSIKQVGQLTPGTFVRLRSGKLVIISGLTRWLACKELKISWQGIELPIHVDESATKKSVGEKLTFEDREKLAVNQLVATERMASQHERSLNSAQRAIDAAHLSKEVFGPAARARQLSGKKAENGEKGEAHSLAAAATGATASAIKVAAHVIGTKVESLVKEGLITKLSQAKKIAVMKNKADQRKAIEAARSKDTKRLRLLLDNSPHKDNERNDIPDTLSSVFDCQKQLLNYIKKLKQVENWLSECVALSLGDYSNDLKPVIRSLEQCVPHAVCPACNNDRKECRLCDGARWVTAEKYAKYQEQGKERRPRIGR